MRPYAIGYSTCGFAAGRTMPVLLEKLGELGYDGVELELDRERLHPHDSDASVVREVRRTLERTKLRAALGTGGRHVLTKVRHHPGAVSREAEARAQWCSFVVDAMDMAGELGVDTIMIHSGYAPEQTPAETAWGWLVESMGKLATEAERRNKTLALEWHPEMFLRTKADYLRVRREVGSPRLACTLDVGHAHCTEDEPLPDVIRELAAYTAHVQLEDMKDRVHKHLRLGEGQIDFAAVFRAFDETRFAGVVALEFNAGDLGGNGDDLAASSIEFLRARRLA
jgi:sugar phosphate isomerase/epimerase